MFELYYIVLFTEADGLVGTHPVYISEDENKDEVLYRNVKNCRKAYRSDKEKIYMFNKKREQITDVTDKLSYLLEGNEKDNQINKWIDESYERLHHIGHIEIEHGYFQTVFKNYLEKKPNAEDYSFDSNENSMTFKTEVKGYTLIFEPAEKE